MLRAKLIGQEPNVPLGYEYAADAPFDAVVIGSLTLGQLLHFSDDTALGALAQGKPVILYTPGLPAAPKNRALAGSLAGKQRELKNWGVTFTDGAHKRLITAQEAKKLRAERRCVPPDAVLTPLAKEILEGSD